jgi:hypothetical protein
LYVFVFLLTVVLFENEQTEELERI